MRLAIGDMVMARGDKVVRMPDATLTVIIKDGLVHSIDSDPPRGDGLDSVVLIPALYDYLVAEQRETKAKELADAEAAFAKHYDVLMNSASKIAKEMADREMTRLDGVISSLREIHNPLSDQLNRLADQWQGVIAQMHASREKGKGLSTRKYGAAIRQVIERIVLKFEPKDCGSQLRSTLCEVEIIPLTDMDATVLRIEDQRGPG